MRALNSTLSVLSHWGDYPQDTLSVRSRLHMCACWMSAWRRWSSTPWRKLPTALDWWCVLCTAPPWAGGSLPWANLRLGTWQGYLPPFVDPLGARIPSLLTWSVVPRLFLQDTAPQVDAMLRPIMQRLDVAAINHSIHVKPMAAVNLSQLFVLFSIFSPPGTQKS